MRQMIDIVRQPLRFNMSHQVKVKLTPRGHQRLKEIETEIGMGSLFRHLKIDEDGWTYFSLWEIAAHFGSIMYNGCEVPFETEIILLPDENRLAWEKLQR